MKKAICITLALVMVLALAACGGNAAKTYTVTHENVEDVLPDTPFSAHTSTMNSMASGYAGSFGNFVDSVAVVETLTIEGDNYTYVWEAKCGTESEDNPTGIYWGTFTYTGTVASSADGKITVNAPTTAKFSLHSTNQMATNAEMVGYFGTDGYEVTHETTECPYGNILFGEELLNWMAVGTFNVNGDAIVSFTAG